MATHISDTFDGPVDQRYVGDTFDSCTFQGVAKACNFSRATFTGCTFDPGFLFKDCNLQGADGVEDVVKVGGSYMASADLDAAISAVNRARRHPGAEPLS